MINSGCINIDKCRMPFKDNKDVKKSDRLNCTGKQYGGGLKGQPLNDFNKKYGRNRKHNSLGRFPANLIISNEVLG